MGKDGDGADLRISTELLDYLFEPLSAVLKDQGRAVIELSDQMKVLVTLVTAHPTRLTLSELLKDHDKQASVIKATVEANTARVEKFMWVSGIIWAVVAILLGWFHWGPKG